MTQKSVKQHKNTVARDAQAQAFILDYLRENVCVDVCNQVFHNEFALRFGGEMRTVKGWDSTQNMLAMRLIKEMYCGGILKRHRSNVDVDYAERQPRWVYIYSLNKKETLPRWQISI